MITAEKTLRSMKRLDAEMEREQPRIVSRYKDYAITQGVTNGHYYVFKRDEFVGMAPTMDIANSLISLREGEPLDRSAIERTDGN